MTNAQTRKLNQKISRRLCKFPGFPGVLDTLLKKPKQPLNKPLTISYQQKITLMFLKKFRGSRTWCKNYRRFIDSLEPFVPTPLTHQSDQTM